MKDILLQDSPLLSCVVVDNCSPDGSLPRLESALAEESRVLVVSASSNGGYASGNNLGACVAIEKFEPRYLLIINPDVRLLDRGTISSLVAFMNVHKDAGVASPKVVLPGGLVQGPYKRPSLALICFNYLFPLYWYFARKSHQKEFSNSSLAQRCFRTVGACMLLRADCFAAVGMFDEGTFLESEEPILAERLAKVGRYFYHDPEVTAVHHHSRSGNISHTLASLKFYFKKYRNAGPISLATLELSAKFYYAVYESLARRLSSSDLR